MASIASDPNGRKRLLFIDGNGKRHTVRLGKMQQRHAEGVRIKVESVLSALAARQPLDQETRQWALDIPDELHSRLAAAGLLKPRAGRTLGQWLEVFLEDRADLKRESRRKLEQTKAKLLAFFAADRQLHQITAEEAAAWRADLLTQGLSEAATKTHTGNAKTIMAEAVRRDLLPESPFAALKGGVTATQNRRYVTPAEMEKLLAVCPDSEWRLLIGLARLAGLRTPSEVLPLTWADVDFERGRLRVRSPKTERYRGHEVRLVPIVPRLMQLLQDRFDAAAPGDRPLIGIKSISGRRRKMKHWMELAGIQPWDDTWQTLRRSCEIEWAQHFPQFAVSRWIGHSITVSGRHYANAIPDELFERAAGKEAAQNAAQHPAESGRNDWHRPETGLTPKASNPLPIQHLRDDASLYDFASEWSRGESNPRAEAVSRMPLRV